MMKVGTNDKSGAWKCCITYLSVLKDQFGCEHDSLVKTVTSVRLCEGLQLQLNKTKAWSWSRVGRSRSSSGRRRRGNFGQSQNS